jgi:hypothetical protein
VSPLAERRAKLALVLALTVYGIVCLLHPGTYRWIDSLDLAIHESGHLVFGPFGELIGVLGGTLMQLLVPIAFTAYFAHRRDRFSAMVTLWWLAQNCWNISVYVKDARAQELPLVGGGEHDWAFLLDRFGLLDQDQMLGGMIHIAGALLFGWAMLRAYSAATAPPPPPPPPAPAP